MITTVVIDGMGGGIGAEIITRIRKVHGDRVFILALGTNGAASDRMMQAKADRGATGENAIRISVKGVDYIIGPVGIAFPNSMMGEISPQIAEIISLAEGKKILIPVSQPHYTIIGVEGKTLSEFIHEAVLKIKMVDRT